MSVAFNGTTSKVENTTATGFDVDTLTVLFRSFARSRGEGNIGRVLSVNEGARRPSIFHGVANVLTIENGHSVQNGRWTFPCTDSMWNYVAIRYDRSSSVNRVNVTVTETQTPSGTRDVHTGGYCVGNRTEQSETWDGKIEHLQFFTSILSDAEADAAIYTPGAYVTNQLLWLPLLTASDLNDYSGGARHGTGTSVTNGGPVDAVRRQAALNQAVRRAAYF